MPANSFKELEKLNEDKFRGREDRLKSNINHSVGIFQFIGDLVELYLPKVFSLFSRMSGGGPSNADHTSDEERPKYPNTIDKP